MRIEQISTTCSEGSINVPLNEINKHLAKFPKETPFVLYCAGRYRNMVAASILKQRGWDDFVDAVEGLLGFPKRTFNALPMFALQQCCRRFR